MSVRISADCFYCPHCKSLTKADEDGCCSVCGGDCEIRQADICDRAAADRRDEKVREYYEAASAIVEAVRFGHPIPQAYWTRYGLAGAAVREEYTTDKGEPR